MQIAVFPDTCLFINFAAVDRIDVLEHVVDNRGVWTSSVQQEIADQSHKWSPLTKVWDFMGAALEPTDNERLETSMIRLDFAGPEDDAHKHMGESELLAVARSRYDEKSYAVFSEDRDVLAYCKRKGIDRRSTRGVLIEAARSGYITWKDADRIAQDSLAAGRPVFEYPPEIRQPIPHLGG